MPFIPVDPAHATETDRSIADAQARLQRDPNNSRALLDLTQSFLQKAREVADPSLYTKAAGILALVARANPRDPDVLATRGTLANAQHRFAAALALGRRAVRESPERTAGYAVLVDASNELGLYDDALAATQRMADLRPDLPALSRISYARELRGDVHGAVTAMTQAVTAGRALPGENTAYVQSLLGDLLLSRGEVADAEAMYEAALQTFPGLAAARAGTAKVLVAQGRPAQAAAVLEEVVRVVPLAEYAGAEGDDWAAAGQPAKAAEAYALVGVIARLYAANGVNVDLELALFAADHSPGPGLVARARRGFRARPGYLGHEVVAWSLHATGHRAQAAREIRAALRLGDRDPQLRFHAAVIFDSVGDRGGAVESLDILLAGNPRFSALHAGQVAALAARYGRPMPPPAPAGERP